MSILSPLPFPGSIYMTDNQENIWLRKSFFVQKDRPIIERTKFLLGDIYRNIKSQKIPAKIQQEFGIYNLMQA